MTHIVHVFPALVQILLGLPSFLKMLLIRHNTHTQAYYYSLDLHLHASGVCFGHSHVSSLPSGLVSTSSALHTLCGPSPLQQPLADRHSRSARSGWRKMTDKTWTCKKKIYSNEKHFTIFFHGRNPSTSLLLPYIKYKLCYEFVGLQYVSIYKHGCYSVINKRLKAKVQVCKLEKTTGVLKNPCIWNNFI